MKKTFLAANILVVCLGILNANAQPRGGMGGPPSGPDFDSTISKVFGDNSAFSAKIEYLTVADGKNMTMPGKLDFLDGKARFEMNMSEMKGAKMSASDAEHMKEMGMDTMVVISRPDKKVSYGIYPGLQAYAEMPAGKSKNSSPVDKCTIEYTEIGKETFDGHPCIKSKAIVTDADGKKHEATTWNATDLKKFPLKFETIEDGNKITMHFSDVKLAKPGESQFEPPKDYTRYNNMQTMMMQEMMKKMGGGMPPMH